MPNVRVVVVDDSAAMRALFCDILDQAKGVDVVGVANNADKARDLIADVKPDVVTLDVEMPGMSGMEFLEEIMSTNPLPVIMLSSITQAGTGTAEKALQLGAVHCFPKPLHTSQEEFSATVQQLGDIVIKAAAGELGLDAPDGNSSYEPDGRIVAMASGRDGLDALRAVLAAYPANCPPTVAVLDADRGEIDNAVTTMRGTVACEIKSLADGAPLEPGTVYLAYDPAYHVAVEPGDTPRLRLLERDPVGGIRPCADLLFGSLARANVPAIGGVLLGNGSDGAKGLQMLCAANRATFALKPAEYTARERFDAVTALGFATNALPQADVPEWILDQTNAATPDAEEPEAA